LRRDGCSKYARRRRHVDMLAVPEANSGGWRADERQNGDESGARQAWPGEMRVFRRVRRAKEQRGLGEGRGSRRRGARFSGARLGILTAVARQSAAGAQVAGASWYSAGVAWRMLR